MSFGLKNAGVTYQKRMDYIFKGMLNRNVEVHVYDIVVKSDSSLQHVQDRSEGSFSRPSKPRHATQPRQVHVRGRKRKLFGFYAHSPWHRSEPGKM